MRYIEFAKREIEQNAKKKISNLSTGGTKVKKVKNEYRQYWSEESRARRKRQVWGDINLILAIMALIASIIMPIIREALA